MARSSTHCKRLTSSAHAQVPSSSSQISSHWPVQMCFLKRARHFLAAKLLRSGGTIECCIRSMTHFVVLMVMAAARRDAFQTQRQIGERMPGRFDKTASHTLGLPLCPMPAPRTHALKTCSIGTLAWASKLTHRDRGGHGKVRSHCSAKSIGSMTGTRTAAILKLGELENGTCDRTGWE